MSGDGIFIFIFIFLSACDKIELIVSTLMKTAHLIEVHLCPKTVDLISPLLVFY